MADKKSLIIGILTGVVVATAGVVTFSLIYAPATAPVDTAVSPVEAQVSVATSTQTRAVESIQTEATTQISGKLPNTVQTYNNLETEFLDLDEKFNNELKNVYPSDSSSDTIVNSSFSSALQAKTLLSNIISKVNSIVKFAQDHSQSGKEKEWFATCVKCYVVRQDIYNKYSKIIDNQITLIGLTRLENVLIDDLKKLASTGKEIDLYIAAKDKSRLFESIDKLVITANSVKKDALEMKQVLSLTAFDDFAKYADGTISLFLHLKQNVESVGFTVEASADDQAIIAQALALAQQRSEILTKYGDQTSDWVFKNRDSIQKDIDRLFIEANQTCTKASVIYTELFPGY